MDIHKPKPIRNWREFAKEYAIIVLGVATALAAEQAVEWLHWQGEVKAARQAIRAEMAITNMSFFDRRIAIAPCMDRQAAEATRILDDLEAKRPPSRFTTFQNGAGTTFRDSEWQSERSAQSLTHFPRAELARMGAYYSQLRGLEINLRDEGEAWRALSVLRRPPKEMPVSDLLRLRAALETAKNSQRQIVLNAARQLRLSRQIGVPTPPYPRERVEKFCTTNVEEWVAYAATIDVQ